MGVQEQLEQLRALVHAGASSWGWTQICVVLNEMEDEAAQVGLDYARQHVEAWPLTFRDAAIGHATDLNPPPVWWPLVGAVTLSCYELRETDARALAHNPGLRHVRHLKLIGVEAALLPVLMASPHWFVTHLTLHMHGVDTLDRALASAPRRDQLTELTLSVDSLRSEGARTLAAWPELRRLTCLNLNHSYFDLDGLRAIMESPFLKQLHTLRLGHIEAFGVDGLRLLGGNVQEMEQLTHIDLARWGLGSAGMAHLANQPWLAQLTGLELGRNDFTTQDVHTLLHSPHLKALHTLELGGNGLDSNVADVLANADALRPLKRLGLMYSNLGDEGVGALLETTCLSHLERLDLEGNALGDEGAKTLATSPYLARLTDLDLRMNQIGFLGAEALAQSPTLGQLHTLNLWNNPIGRRGRWLLRRLPHIGRLTLVV
ncbi:MAG: hypothetical protein AAFX99_06450 [Myxococcota bacterium]